MANISCPKCNKKQGYFQLIDHVNWFICPCCGYKVLRKRLNIKNYELQ